MAVSGIPLSISGAYNYQNFGNSLMVTFVVLDDHLGFTLLGNAYCGQMLLMVMLFVLDVEAILDLGNAY